MRGPGAGGRIKAKRGRPGDEEKMAGGCGRHGGGSIDFDPRARKRPRLYALRRGDGRGNGAFDSRAL
nr:MAG TPA: hypothetical protein [Caudoviricetes sp.]